MPKFGDYKKFEFKQPESEFNAAMASLMRIDQILQDCNESSVAARLGSYPALKLWLSKLWALYQEVVSYISTKKKEFIKKKLQDVLKKAQIIKLKKTEKGRIYQIDNKNAGIVIDSLTKIEERLRKYAVECGMLIVMKKDDGNIDQEWV